MSESARPAVFSLREPAGSVRRIACGVQVSANPPDPPAPDTDESLLLRLQAGDNAGMEVLVRRYERELYGYLRRYLGDADLAADVFQNTFVQVWVKIDQYQPGRAARPWLYAIATNQAIDALRRRARRKDTRADTGADGDPADGRVRTLSDLLPDPTLGPGERAEQTEERAQVRAAVDRLPEGLRQVVILAYFQNLKYQEVADALDIPLGTVKSRLHAALHKLADDWEGDRLD